MLKREFFLKALNAGAYKRYKWVISIFTFVDENEEDKMKDLFPYRVFQNNDGYYFIDPENNNQLSLIEDAPIGSPIFTIKEPLRLEVGDLENVIEPVDTNYGTAVINKTVLCYPFGSKIPYIASRFSAKKIESMIVKRLKDNPENSSEREERWIYVDEYLKYTDAAFSLVAFTQISVPAHTVKSLIQCPGIYELRDKLLDQYKTRLHDPAVIALIDAALIQHYKEWLKDDDSLGFLISKKSIDIVRKKLFMMHGAEMGLEENVDVELIKNSLSEGWDINAFPAMNNSLRAGSFNRGQQTELGGVAVKELLRASSNLRITEDDCGSQLGITILAQKGDEDKLLGFTVIQPGPKGEQTKITEDNVGNYLGKVVKLRSPMFCHLEKTDFCKTCVGDRLATSPTGLPTVVSAYGSTFLALFMSAAHAKGLTVAKMDFITAIS